MVLSKHCQSGPPPTNTKSMSFDQHDLTSVSLYRRMTRSSALSKSVNRDSKDDTNMAAAISLLCRPKRRVTSQLDLSFFPCPETFPQVYDELPYIASAWALPVLSSRINQVAVSATVVWILLVTDKIWESCACICVR